MYGDVTAPGPGVFLRVKVCVLSNSFFLYELVLEGLCVQNRLFAGVSAHTHRGTRAKYCLI